MEAPVVVLSSVPALQAGLDSGGSFGWLWHARTVLTSERSTACPGPMPVMPKVARHLRASMVGQLGAGLASFGFLTFSPQLYRPADQISCDAWQSFSMEASVCLRCDVPQKLLIPFGPAPCAAQSGRKAECRHFRAPAFRAVRLLSDKGIARLVS